MVAYKQLIYPNLDDDPKHPLYVYVYDEKKKKTVLCTNWVGWCLAVCKAAFGATKSLHSALNAWNANTTKHTNYDLPEGVYCLIWWDGYWYDGEYLGHVAIAKRTGDKIKIWSSPYKKSYTFAIFEGSIKDTIAKITKTYKLNQYLGWTETICEKRVIEQVKENKKSNEEICKEVWEGKWGNGKDREKRLTEAGYDYSTIQKMVKDGVGKPEEKKPEPQKPIEEPKEPETVIVPTPEPEPLPEPSNEPAEPIETELTNNNEPKEENMAQKEPVEPAQGPDIEQIGGLIEEASKGITIPTWLKVAGYILGDVLFLVAIEIPMIVNAIQAPNMSVWAEYASKAFMAGGIWVLLVVKLIKKRTQDQQA